MNDSTRRAIRSGLDLALGICAALAVAVPIMGFSAGSVAKIGGLIAGAALVLTKVRNAAEDAGLIPAVLKAPPSPGENPVPKPKRKRRNARGDIGLVGLIIAAVFIAVILAAVRS